MPTPRKLARDRRLALRSAEQNISQGKGTRTEEMGMESIKLRTHVGTDGMLTLRIPVGLSETDVEVVVVIQGIPPQKTPPSPEELGWPPGYFEQTYGSFRDKPLVRGEQGEFEVRDPFP